MKLLIDFNRISHDYKMGSHVGNKLSFITQTSEFRLDQRRDQPGFEVHYPLGGLGQSLKNRTIIIINVKACPVCRRKTKFFVSIRAAVVPTHSDERERYTLVVDRLHSNVS